MARARCGACVALVGLLVSCGGGGGGGDTITVTWGRSPLDVTYILPSALTLVEVAGSLAGGSGTVYADLTITPNGASPFPEQVLTFDGPASNWSADLALDSAAPSGTYTGTITLRLCKDAACKSEYTVINDTLSYVIRLIDPASDAMCMAGTVTTLGPYAAENAVSSGHGTQCATATSNASGGIDGFLLARGLAFPRVEYGQTPDGSPVTGAALPAQLSALDSVTVHAEATEQYTSDYVGRVALDLWLVSDTTQEGGSMPIVGEVQIAIAQNPIAVDTSSCRSATLGGYSWKACALTGTTWPGLVYYLPTPRAWVTLDVVPFLSDFRAHEGNAITGSPYLPAVAFGDIVEQGYCESLVTGFKVTVVKH